MLFCTVILIATLWQTGKAGRISKETLSNTLLYNINYKQWYIVLYGAVRRSVGKRAVEVFSIFKNSYDKLIKPQGLLTDDEIISWVGQIIPISEYCEEHGIPFIILTSILPVQDMLQILSGIFGEDGISL